MENGYENDTGNKNESIATKSRYFKKELWRGLFILFPILGLGSLGLAPINLVADQLVYVKLGGDLNEKNYNHSKNCINNTKNEDHIQEQVTQFRMYMRLGSCITSIIFMPLWGALSDKYGRHIAIIVSAIGALLVTLSYTGIWFIKEIPIWALILGDICHGICGRSFNLLLLATAAVVADIMPRGQRTFMMITLDFILLIFATFSQIGIGYWIKYSGFTPSLIFMLVTQILTGFYAFIVIPKYIKPPAPDSVHTNGNFLRNILHYFVNTYRTFVKRRKYTYRAQLLLIILVILLQHIAFYGVSTVQNIYFLGMPLCWNSVMLGLFSGISIGLYGTTNMIVAAVFIKSGTGLKFMVAGLISALIGNIVYGFSTTTIMMYVSLVVASLTILFSPSARCVISDRVDENEQGAALAGYVLPTVVGEIVGNSLYTVIYDVTIDSCPRCFYFVSAGFYGIALFFLGIIIYLSRIRTMEEELKGLTEEKEDG